MALNLADQRGTAAVEFAIILPVLLLCYFGCVQIAQAVAVNRMTALAVSTVVNITSQYSTVSASQTMPGILNAAASVLTPYPVSKAIVIVSCITINSQGNAAVSWSQSLNGTARPAGQAVSLPTLLDTPNTSIIMGEISYAYSSTVDYLSLGTLNLSSTLYMPTRNGSTITLTP